MTAENAYTGLLEGLLQGQEVNRQRRLDQAAEALQRQQQVRQQQQDIAATRQQAFENEMAQKQFGLSQEQFVELKRQHDLNYNAKVLGLHNTIEEFMLKMGEQQHKDYLRQYDMYYNSGLDTITADLRAIGDVQRELAPAVQSVAAQQGLLPQGGQQGGMPATAPASGLGDASQYMLGPQMLPGSRAAAPPVGPAQPAGGQPQAGGGLVSPAFQLKQQAAGDAHLHSQASTALLQIETKEKEAAAKYADSLNAAKLATERNRRDLVRAQADTQRVIARMKAQEIASELAKNAATIANIQQETALRVQETDKARSEANEWRQREKELGKVGWLKFQDEKAGRKQQNQSDLKTYSGMLNQAKSARDRATRAAAAAQVYIAHLTKQVAFFAQGNNGPSPDGTPDAATAKANLASAQAEGTTANNALKDADDQVEILKQRVDQLMGVVHQDSRILNPDGTFGKPPKTAPLGKGPLTTGMSPKIQSDIYRVRPDLRPGSTAAPPARPAQRAAPRKPAQGRKKPASKDLTHKSTKDLLKRLSEIAP